MATISKGNNPRELKAESERKCDDGGGEGIAELKISLFVY